MNFPLHWAGDEAFGYANGALESTGSELLEQLRCSESVAMSCTCQIHGAESAKVRTPLRQGLEDLSKYRELAESIVQNRFTIRAGRSVVRLQVNGELVPRLALAFSQVVPASTSSAFSRA